MIVGKTVIFLGDGMADRAVPELGGRTPLQAAHTPAMDALAAQGTCGTLLTLPDGFPTGSEVANMSVLGCDVASEYCGRGPLEAAGRGIPLGTQDKAFRVNLVSAEDGILTDYSGGHIAQPRAEQIIDILNDTLGSDDVRFHAGVSYRTILVLSGPRFSHRVSTEKPDDHHGDRIADNLPSALEPGAEFTAQFLRRLIAEAPAILAASPVGGDPNIAVNGIWPWSGGRAGAIRSLADRYGIRSAVISAVDVILGLGRCLGMDVINVPGATGYVDTNYEGKADAAIRALESHDLVYLHVEAMDEASHERNLAMKLQAIEDFDARVVGRVLSALGPDVNAAVLADHPVPISTGKHTREPVPVAVRMAGRPADGVMTYDEDACPRGSLGALQGPQLMDFLFGKH